MRKPDQRLQPGAFCASECQPGHHVHVCPVCGRTFKSKRSDTQYCPAPSGSPSRLSDCAGRAWQAANIKRCAHVYPEGDQCENNAQPGLKDGYCSAHHRRSVKGQDMSVRLRRRAPGRGCGVDGCGERHYAKGLCRYHWGQRYEGRATTLRRDRKEGIRQCSVEVDGEHCERKVRTGGLCDMHAQRYRATGETGSVAPQKRAYGEGHLNDRGYVELQRNGRKTLEHIWVVEAKLGHQLDTSKFEVHHKNGIRNDNQLSNLELKPLAHGAGQHFEDLVPFIVRHGLDELYRRDGNCEAFPSWARKI